MAAAVVVAEVVVVVVVVVDDDDGLWRYAARAALVQCTRGVLIQAASIVVLVSFLSIKFNLLKRVKFRLNYG